MEGASEDPHDVPGKSSCFGAVGPRPTSRYGHRVSSKLHLQSRKALIMSLTQTHTCTGPYRITSVCTPRKARSSLHLQMRRGEAEGENQPHCLIR